MNITKEKQVEAVKALDFLRGHPAMSSEASGDSIIDGFWFMMAECCKRGLTSYRGDVGIRIYADSDDAEKYAAIGVDMISMGRLTHSSPAFDVSLIMDPLNGSNR